MDKTILKLSNISQIIVIAAFAVLVFLGYIWLFVMLRALRKMSKRFLADSKRENFEGGLRLLRKTRSLFALTILLDVCMVFTGGLLFNRISFPGLSDALRTTVLLAITAFHLAYGIPVLRLGIKAGSLFRNMYPPVPKAEVYKKPDFNSEPQKNEDDFFEVSETNCRTEASASHAVQKETEPEDNDEIIEYDDEGYIGAWRLEKSGEDITEGKEREEEVKSKECPFCGTLNGINNRVCDFCGADIV